MNNFEKQIRVLTTPFNDQYPRPWMTNLTNPLDGEIFIVGMNQAKGYKINQVGSHEDHLDSLFNRNGRSCRSMYDQITNFEPSPTRKNIDELNKILEINGRKNIIETNVICYSTPMSADLQKIQHRGGKHRGSEIFTYLFKTIKPKITILHGTGTIKEFSKLFSLNIPSVPKSSTKLIYSETKFNNFKTYVFPIPSLSPPAYNRWISWSNDYLAKLSLEVDNLLNHS